VKAPAPSIAVGRIVLTGTPQISQHLHGVARRRLTRAIQPFTADWRGRHARADVDDSAVVDDVPPRRLKGEEGALGVDREEPATVIGCYVSAFAPMKIAPTSAPSQRACFPGTPATNRLARLRHDLRFLRRRM
jgi:hypothetical protein